MQNAMQTSIKYIVKTDSNKTYILHIMDAIEYKRNQFVGLFLYHDEELELGNELWPNLRHRLLFENSVEAIKDKVFEYASGRNEKIMFIDSYPPFAA
jgi:hypothetical protein